MKKYRFSQYIVLVCLVSIAAALLGCGSSSSSPLATSKFLYVANVSSHNISGFSLDGTTGALSAIGTTAATSQVRELATTPDGKFLYAANQDLARINAYSINSDTGALTELTGTNPSPYTTGNNVIKITIDPAGKYLYSCNMSGTITAFTIGTDGKLTLINNFSSASYGVATDVKVHPSGKWLFASTQGPDGLVRWTVGTDGALSSASFMTFGVNNDGLAIAPGGNSLYVTTGGTHNVFGFKIDSTTGALTATTPATFDIGGNSEGVIVIDPSGKYLYVDAIMENKLFTFSINSDGSLTAGSPASLTLTNYASSIAIEPSGNFAYIGGGNSNSVLGATLSKQNGTLTLMSPSFPAGTSPVGIAFAGQSVRTQ